MKCQQITTTGSAQQFGVSLDSHKNRKPIFSPYRIIYIYFLHFHRSLLNFKCLNNELTRIQDKNHQSMFLLTLLLKKKSIIKSRKTTGRI